jgi:hypothetical protein
LGQPTLRTSAEILNGSAGDATTVGMEWRTRVRLPQVFTREDTYLCSDIVRLSGINLTPEGEMLPGRNQTDRYVLQMSYDPDAVGRRRSFHLVWLNRGERRLLGDNDDAWRYAVDGNFGPQTRQYFLKEFDPSTDFHIGYEGWDPANHVVWAVVNHDGDFAVVSRSATVAIPMDSGQSMVPEPGPMLIWSLLGGCTIALNWWRKRPRPA